MTATCLLQAGRSDFHVHTNLSPDAGRDCTLESLARVAAGLGLREVGLTDHVQANGEREPGQSWQCTDLAAFEHRCRRIREGAWPVRLLSGWEVDYYDGGRYSFVPDTHLALLDYVLLAHHAFGHMTGEAPAAIARYLLRITMAMAVEPYADVIAHPFYFAPPPDRHGQILSCLSDRELAEAFQAMKEHGKAAEITSYQFSADLRGVEQMKRVYSVARQTGVKFTLDSDAHRLWDLAEGLRCLYVLSELGFADDDFVDYAALRRLKGADAGVSRNR
jgi:histidinol phosphatase-like PHP family hydrolase